MYNKFPLFYFVSFKDGIVSIIGNSIALSYKAFACPLPPNNS